VECVRVRLDKCIQLCVMSNCRELENVIVEVGGLEMIVPCVSFIVSSYCVYGPV